MEKKRAFLETIYHLRTIEQVILYNKVMEVTTDEEQETVEFLKDEYEKECLNFPFEAPQFDGKAALWASEIVYFSAQFLLNRENTSKDLDKFLPDFKGEINASALLSADLCLRFLPQVLQELKNIDVEDPIIPILKKHLDIFHYSAIGFEKISDTVDFTIFENQCFKQLYLDRITERKAISWSQLPGINRMLQQNFGDYSSVFWNYFEIIN